MSQSSNTQRSWRSSSCSVQAIFHFHTGKPLKAKFAESECWYSWSTPAWCLLTSQPTWNPVTYLTCSCPADTCCHRPECFGVGICPTRATLAKGGLKSRRPDLVLHDGRALLPALPSLAATWGPPLPYAAQWWHWHHRVHPFQIGCPPRHHHNVLLVAQQQDHVTVPTVLTGAGAASQRTWTWGCKQGYITMSTPSCPQREAWSRGNEGDRGHSHTFGSVGTHSACWGACTLCFPCPAPQLRLLKQTPLPKRNLPQSDRGRDVWEAEGPHHTRAGRKQCDPSHLPKPPLHLPGRTEAACACAHQPQPTPALSRLLSILTHVNCSPISRSSQTHL